MVDAEEERKTFWLNHLLAPFNYARLQRLLYDFQQTDPEAL